MRSLNSNLLATQKLGSGVPTMYVYVDGTDRFARVLSLRHQEKAFGGVGTIILKNDDGLFTGLDFRGKDVSIWYGYGGLYSNAPPLWVYGQQDISHEGVLAIQLDCMDLWNKISLEKLVSGGYDVPGTVVGQLEPGMTITGEVSGTKARIIYVGANYISVNQVMLGLVNPGSGGEKLRADINPNSYLQTSGAPTAWGGGPGPGWPGTFTYYQIIQSLLGGIANTTLDNNNDGILNTSKPTYTVENGANMLDVIKDLMARTKSYARVKEDGRIHLGSVASDPSPDYAYHSSDHTILEGVRNRRLVLPSRYLIYNSRPGAAGTTKYSGVAEDTAASAQFGRAVTEVMDLEVQSDAEANTIAGAMLRRTQMEAIVGTIQAPMNCGQELWDFIQVTDTRAGVVYNGWVGEIIREYKPEEGIYRITVGLGGLAEAAYIPPTDIYYPAYPKQSAPDPQDPPIIHTITSPSEMLSLVDFEFTPTGRTTFSWGAGNVRFVDGTSESVDAGNRTMSNSTEYAYKILGNSTLQWTTDLGSTQGLTKILIAQATWGVDANDKVQVIPIRGKVKINLDNIFNGLAFGRTKTAALSNDGLVLLDAVVNGTNYGLVKKAALDANGLVLLDAVVDGSTYARVKKSSLSANGLVLLEQVVIGDTFGLVNRADITAGHINLSSVIEDTDHQTVDSSQATGASHAYNFHELKLTALGVSIASSSSQTKVQLDANGLSGYYQNALQFSVSALDGTARAGAGNVRLDVNGININGGYLSFADSWTVYVPTNTMPLGIGSRRALLINTPGGLWSPQSLWTDNGGVLGVHVDGGDGVMYFSNYDVGGTRRNHVLAPFEDGYCQLGSIGTAGITRRWNYVVAYHGIFKEDVLPETHDIGNLGVAGKFWHQLAATYVYSDHVYAAENVVNTLRLQNWIQPDRQYNSLISLGSPTNKFDYASVNHIYFWDQIQFVASGSLPGSNVGIFPTVGNAGHLGNSAAWWERVYAGTVTYKTLATFHDEDDVSLVRKLHSSWIVHQDKDKTGKVHREERVLDPTNAHPRLMDESGEFYSAGAMDGLLVGAISQHVGNMEDKLAALEARIKKLEKVK